MNDMPIMWAKEIKDAYPARSGVNGWASMKLLLACRRALFESTWQEIIDGITRYKEYCEKAGIAGTAFVQSPLRFIQDGSYLESFEHRAPQTKEQTARHQLHEQEMAALDSLAGRAEAVGLVRYANEPSASFRTRIDTAERHGLCGDQNRHTADHASRDIGNRVASLVDRLRIAK